MYKQIESWELILICASEKSILMLHQILEVSGLLNPAAWITAISGQRKREKKQYRIFQKEKIE